MRLLILLLVLFTTSLVRGEELLHNATGLDVEGLGGDFTLNGPGGAPVSLADYRGRVVLLYFGYTHCPDVCPMSLGILKAVMGRLGEEAGQVQGVFVTVDPTRDSGPRLQEYVRYYHPGFVGLSGDPQATYRAARKYGVLYARQDSDSAAGYLMAHSDYIYLLDREGRLRGLYNSASSPAEVEAGVRALLQAEP